MKRIALAVLALCFAGAGFAIDRNAEAEAVWLKYYSGDKAKYSYLEADTEGNVLYYTDNGRKAVTRTGQVKKTLARDLFQEIENLDHKGLLKTGDMYTKSEIYEITANSDGELITRGIGGQNLTRGFRMAFGDIEAAAKKLPVNSKVSRLLIAESVERQASESIMAAKSFTGTTVETSDMEGVPQLMRAVQYPNRHVTLTSDEKMALDSFFLEKRVRQEHGIYYISASRGDFKLRTVYANR